ncbi:DMT family transporter [Shimia sp. R11_0]|uniref:DMT family transporter n=1 Tax=Shimia sp. R11_0 TaxID=2821096 RepID=UPI001ADD4C5D|nr:DMT family transporter [Shimia sp. R11_0]MBO9477361.1 DMT family transporter [Shimia sp. R11_0]
MSAHIATDRAANRLGSLFMIAAMAGFAVEDAFLKAAARDLPIAQVMVLFGGGGAMVFALWLRAKGQALAPKAVLSRPMQVRVFFEIIGRLFFTLSLALTPLSSTTVILQATPLVVVAFAALVLGERVGWRRWLAIVIGLAGVVLVVRPGGDSFSVMSLLAVIGMLGFAGRDLASRAAPASLSTAVLGLYGFLAIVLAGALYGGLWERQSFHTPPPMALLAVLAAVACGVFAYSALMKAMRTGEVSAVTPFRYSRLLFGVGLGVVVFGEALDQMMILGSVLIVMSGFVILWRGRSAQG